MHQAVLTCLYSWETAPDVTGEITDRAIADQAKTFNSIAGPYDQRAFSPLDPTTHCLSRLSLAIYMLVFVNFDALSQASDFRIERRKLRRNSH